MRAFCTVSAPLEVCASSAEQLSPGSRFLALRLLGHQQPKTLYFLVDAKSRVREVYTQTCLHFATQGMLDTELFGLAVLIDGEYMFADPESKLSKYGPKSWRSSHTHGLDANGRPLLELHFRVQFYIESPFMLKDETTRHNYYLQLKYNALQRDIPREYAEQSMILLAGLALQADLGDAPCIGSNNSNSSGGSGIVSGGGASEAKTSGDLSDSGKGLDVAGGEQKVGKTVSATTSSSSSSAAATTTLPKISKRANLVNERVLRLSSYMASTRENVMGMDGLKRVLGAAKTPLSPSSSSSSISRGPSNASTNASVSTNASSCNEYFRLEDYLPEHLRTAWAASALRACHRENRGLSQADAELHYIQQACLVHECINAHTFRMRMSKSELGPGNSWFVVYAKGIKIFGAGTGPDGQQQQITFLWPNITKLSFERKKFEIRSGESKITLYATSDEKNKMLLTLCKETHQFSMKIAARLKEVIKREEEESNCLHACYVYSRSLHLPTYKSKNDQRISVISSTSSNTTSGIVSDRVHSEDELEIMINTPPAPIAAPSTESLALAHLLDRPSVSRQTSSVGQVSLKDLEEQLAALTVRQQQQSQRNSPTELSNTSSTGNSTSTSGSSIPNSSKGQRNNTDSSTDSPSSQHNIGSQCSSTCSTVVVASSTNDNNTSLATLAVRSNLNTSDSSHQRKNSTSSSLELGFSHTAQNSTLSEPDSSCIDHDFITSTRDETESVSGVYTLVHAVAPTETSGVYTMHSSEMTGQSSEIAESEKSSHYGIFQPSQSKISEEHLRLEHNKLQDSVDGGNYHHGKRMKNIDFRLRSDSNISTTDSFRGDGSDPADVKHTLLSAEELTDLIVGRGSYPNRKTVSSTLDSDCDYVTLPLSMTGESYIQGHQDTAPTEDHVEDLISDLLPTDPPAPPKRVDSNMPNLTNIRTRSPPPYNARHHKTGLCGPPIRSTISNNSPPAVNNTPLNLPVIKSTIPNHVPLSLTDTKPLAKPLLIAKPPTPPIQPPVIKRRDPPPYPAASKPRPTSLISVASSTSSLNQPGSNVFTNVGGSMTSLKSEEIIARFITSRPQINIQKAQTFLVNENTKPSYATPTNSSLAGSSTGSICSHHIPSHLSQHSVPNSNYVSGSQASLNLHHPVNSTPTTPTQPTNMSHTTMSGHHHVTTGGVLSNHLGIPMVSYSLHGAHKSMSSLHQQQQPPPPPPPFPAELKQTAPRTCVLLPVIKPRQYLPPPPPSLPRQPPPPPPNQLAGIYSSPLARKQLELYQQQLYSDVDYVIYPLQDPAVSQQEYLDAKQGSILAAMAQTPPPPHAHHHHHPYLAAYHHAAASQAWEACKGHAIYRSTPYLPLALSTHSRYASTQNLSDSYVQLPSAYSPMYSPSMASICSSYEPPPPPPLHPAHLHAAAAAAAVNPTPAPLFARSRSDDNILNTLDSLPKVKRLPPPPPPPYVDRRLKKPPMPAPTERPPPIPSKPIPSMSSASISIPNESIVTTTRSHLPPRKPITLSVPRNGAIHMTKTSSGAQWAGERPKTDMLLGRPTQNTNILAQLQASAAAAKQNQLNSNNTNGSSISSSNNTPTPNEFDIALLREKSKHLDLPLISALCNDRSLIKQTKVLVNQSRPRPGLCNTTLSGTSSSNSPTFSNNSTASAANSNTLNKLPLSSLSLSHNNGNNPTTMSSTSSSNLTTTTATTAATSATSSSKLLASTVAAKTRKTSISHRHPNDKLPPLPMQLAEANNYVMDPAILKHHKSYNSHT
ncbi:protein expanded isoform X1 [Lucilia cuprina]|uniref:protein expanded isoform X1 n=1 Tax=Lucilia cuprina TaxID=7375 RepID=UPI001F0588C7|nr:protein expanded isoform X1 [Lucilia cuprina]